MCASSSPSIETRRRTEGILLSQVCLWFKRIHPQSIPVYLLIRCVLALLSAREVAENARNGPVAAIDARDDILDAIRDTRLSDAESWRSVIQNAPLTERKYLSQVYELLTDLAMENRTNDSTESYTNAFIYNYRTGSCVSYDLGP